MVYIVLGIVLPVMGVYLALQFVPQIEKSLTQETYSDLTQEAYNAGEAWLQTRPIMVPDGHKGYLVLRIFLRTHDREMADYICKNHPRLADELQQMIQDRPDIIELSYKGDDKANEFVRDALKKRIGERFFHSARLSNTDRENFNPTDRSRYECRKGGMRLIFRASS